MVGVSQGLCVITAFLLLETIGFYASFGLIAVLRFSTKQTVSESRAFCEGRGYSVRSCGTFSTHFTLGKKLTFG